MGNGGEAGNASFVSINLLCKERRKFSKQENKSERTALWYAEARMQRLGCRPGHPQRIIGSNNNCINWLPVAVMLQV